MKRKISIILPAVLICTLMLFPTSLQLFGVSLAPVSSGASAPSIPSCTTNSILKGVFPGGAPNAISALTGVGTSAALSRSLIQLPIYPDAFPNGTLYWNDSVTSSYSHNSNFTQWTFNIKSGMTWADGTPITSQDILNTWSSNFALNATYDPDNLGSVITSVTKVNNSAALFTLNQQFAKFPLYIGSLLNTYLYPSSFIQGGPGNNGFGTQVGSGPFWLSGYSVGQTQAIYYRNQYYNPLPGPCELQISYVEADSDAAALLASGQYDFGVVDASSVAAILKNPNMHVIEQPAADLLEMQYNISAYPYNQLAFRQALAYGIDQNQILEQAFGNYGETAYSSEGLTPPDASQWYNANQAQYSYNQTIALNDLSSIGISKGSDGYLQFPNGTDISLTIWTPNALTGETIASQIVASNLESLGFKVTPIVTLQGRVIGDSHSNFDNIDNELIMWEWPGVQFGSPYFDAQQWVQIPMKHYISWEGNATLQAEYNGNLSTFSTTDNPTQLADALANIQAINSQNLPMLALGYPDYLWAYSTQRWTNWPSFLAVYGGGDINSYGLSALVPAGQTQTTTTSNTQSTVTSTVTSTTTTSVTSSSSSHSSSVSLLSTITVVVAIVLMAGVALLVVRKRPAT